GLDTSNLGCYTTCRSMGCRLTVGHLTLDQAVGVRIPAPQPSTQEAGHNARPLSFPRTVFSPSNIRGIASPSPLLNGGPAPRTAWARIKRTLRAQQIWANVVGNYLSDSTNTNLTHNVGCLPACHSR